MLALRHAAFHEDAIHVHRQPRQRRVRRQGEVKRAFQLPVAVVEISLIDRGASKAILDEDDRKKFQKMLKTEEVS